MKAKSESKTRERAAETSVRPHRWIQESSAASIAEALLALDPVKAVEVAARVTARAGPLAEAALERVRSDPKKAALRAGTSLLHGLLDER